LPQGKSILLPMDGSLRNGTLVGARVGLKPPHIKAHSRSLPSKAIGEIRRPSFLPPRLEGLYQRLGFGLPDDAPLVGVAIAGSLLNRIGAAMRMTSVQRRVRRFADIDEVSALVNEGKPRRIFRKSFVPLPALALSSVGGPSHVHRAGRLSFGVVKSAGIAGVLFTTTSADARASKLARPHQLTPIFTIFEAPRRVTLLIWQSKIQVNRL
jgi:hypothetical protein